MVHMENNLEIKSVTLSSTPYNPMQKQGEISGTSIKIIHSSNASQQESALLEKINKLFNGIQKEGLEAFEITNNGIILHYTGYNKENIISQDGTETNVLISDIIKLSQHILQINPNYSAAPSEKKQIFILDPTEASSPEQPVMFHVGESSSPERPLILHVKETISLEAFDQMSKETDKLIDSIYRQERDTMCDLLELINDNYQLMNNENMILQVRHAINKASFLAKEMSECNQTLFFKPLKKNLLNMTKEHNIVIDKIEQLEKSKVENGHLEEKDEQLLQELQTLKKDMRKKIHQYNEKISRLDLTTSEFTAYKSHAMSYISVAEKKLALLEKKSTTKNPLKKHKINQELKKAPTPNEMKTYCKDIKEKWIEPQFEIDSPKKIEKDEMWFLVTEMKWVCTKIDEVDNNKSMTIQAKKEELERLREYFIQLHNDAKQHIEQKEKIYIEAHPNHAVLAEFSAYKSHLAEYAPAIEKKITLLEKRYTRNPLKRNKINKELKKLPTNQEINQHLSYIENQLNSEAEIQQNEVEMKVLEREALGQLKALYPVKKMMLPCFRKIKNKYLFEDNLKWGASYLNRTLTTPANWTTIRKAFVKESESGRMYVSVSENEPLNIQNEGGVPAGLRKEKKGGYNQRATNLMKTTSYILSDDGTRCLEAVSFRGGQFPTVAAAKEALTEMINSGVPLEALHINALLTPFSLPFATPDKNLLIEHKKNIKSAIALMIKETQSELSNADKYEKPALESKLKTIENIKNHFSISNFGVNEGAVGELRIRGKHLSWLIPGWHTSIKEYSNEASKQLTISLKNKLRAKEKLENYRIQDLDRLGAIVQVGQEMEAIWATNAYAEAKVGNNQFKLPALWKTMDALTGVVCYTDCMSGKDRTGKVESHAQAHLDEIAMNIIEHKTKMAEKFEELKESLGDRITKRKQELNAKIEEEKKSDKNQTEIEGAIFTLEKQYRLMESQDVKQWEEHRAYLTAACFKPEDLDTISERFIQGIPLEKILQGEIASKFNSARIALGIDERDGQPKEFMEQKTLPNSIRMKIKLGTSGISTSTPKRDSPICSRHAKTFPQLAASTIFSNYPIKWDDLPQVIADLTTEGEKLSKSQNLQQPQTQTQMIGYKSYLDKYKKKHIEASNSRYSQFGSLAITQVNTGKPGFKVEGGEPLARATCGFDRDYVLLRILGHIKGWDPSENFEEDFKDLVGLGDFDAETQAIFLSDLRYAGTDMHQYLKLVKDIEEAKMQTFFPQVKVKA